MKETNKKRVSTAVVVSMLLIILTSMITPVDADDNGDSVVAEDSNSYTIRDPIRINGNSDFASQAAQEGWPGDGSPGNPYIIEGYEINGTGYGYGIYISNTTVNFVVRDCYVHNASGVYQDPNKGIPIEISIYNSGIILFNIQNGILENNTMINNVRQGIYVYGCADINVIYNNLPNNGITFSSSDDNVISNNNVSGIGLSGSFGNIITFNNVGREEIHQCHGIYLGYSNDNVINNNTISNQRIGIFEDTCDWNLIEGNTFVNVEIEHDYAYEVVNGNNGNNGNNSNNGNSDTPFIGFALATVAILTAVCLTWKKRRCKGEDPN